MCADIALTFPLKPLQSAIIVNGELNEVVLQSIERGANWHQYTLIIIADGAWDKLLQLEVGKMLSQLPSVCVLGDGDSIINRPRSFVDAPDQNFTDFEKALQFALQNNVGSADVFGASGGEMDHFLGNLSVASKFAKKINLMFYDTYQCYFYACVGDVTIEGAQNKTMSIYPFSQAQMLAEGLAYSVNGLDLDLHSQQSLRNKIVNNTAKMSLLFGCCWFFVER